LRTTGLAVEVPVCLAVSEALELPVASPAAQVLLEAAPALQLALQVQAEASWQLVALQPPARVPLADALTVRALQGRALASRAAVWLVDFAPAQLAVLVAPCWLVAWQLMWLAAGQSFVLPTPQMVLVSCCQSEDSVVLGRALLQVAWLWCWWALPALGMLWVWPQGRQKPEVVLFLQRA